MSLKDEAIRELFEWVKIEEYSGVSFATIVDETTRRAADRYGLKAKVRNMVAAMFAEITFEGSQLIMRHANDENGWVLV